MKHAQFRECIDACVACVEACDRCAAACLQERNVAALARCIGLDIDCAHLCRVAAGAMARGSELVPQFCQFCVMVCETCATECASHEMPHCQECARACNRCAQACIDVMTPTP